MKANLGKYKHTQIGWGIILMLVLLYVATIPLEPATPVLEVILIAVALLFSTLTITVDENNLTWFFGPLALVRKQEAVKEIIACEIVRNEWWWGWGIRYHPWGRWLYNIGGLDAVEITMKSGKAFRLGTDEPAKLKQAIDRWRGQ